MKAQVKLNMIGQQKNVTVFRFEMSYKQLRYTVQDSNSFQKREDSSIHPKREHRCFIKICVSPGVFIPRENFCNRVGLKNSERPKATKFIG